MINIIVAFVFGVVFGGMAAYIYIDQIGKK